MTPDRLKALYGPLRHQSCDSCAAYRTNPRRCLLEHIEFWNNGWYCADHHPKTESPET
jgi:hypothetical protein